MKSLKIILGLFILIILTATVTYAQQQFTHTVTAANKYCNATCSLTNISDPFAILIVSPVLVNGTNRNPHPIGVFYVPFSKKWSIINVDGVALTEGVKFNVQYYLNPDPNQFVFVVNQQGGTPCIDHVGLNANPNAQVLFSPTGSPRGAYFNQYEAKIEYDAAARQWCIVNTNNQPVNAQTAFNIVISSGGITGRTGPIPTSDTNTRPNNNPDGPISTRLPPNRNATGDLRRTNPTSNPPVRVSETTVPVQPGTPKAPAEADRWVLRADLRPTIGPNAEILLFIHGMDSRAEEANDITKALFAHIANRPTSEPVPSQPAAAPSPNAQMAAVLQQLLQKYKGCILEKYETQADMTSRGLAANLSGLLHTNGLQNRDTVVCVAGNQCSRAFRQASFNSLQAQANRGDPTNFETNLEKAIPKDCFQCSKHQEHHTKHVHCTMEAGGNSGFKGPYFEGCKAGVDLNALANSIIRDINGVINSITAAVPQTQVTGGPSVATNYSTVDFPAPEPCENPDSRSGGQPTAVLPADYYSPLIPPAMLDTPQTTNFNVPPARNLGANEGRLRPDLRKAAADAKPLESLRLAAYQFADGNTDLGKAFADLSVTGARAFDDFRIALPKEPFCQSLLAQRPPHITEIELLDGCRTALDRAYRVANFLRTGQRGDTPAEKTRKTNERIALGWIAVSGEDDSPHRPVNVTSSDYPQYDFPVVVEAPLATGPKTVTVRTRFWIAQSQTANPGGSGKNLVMISLDLPTSGYSENLDFERVSQLAEIGNPKWTPLPVPIVVPFEVSFLIPNMPPVLPAGFVIPPGTPLPDFHATGKTPVLDFIETFIVRFAERLEQEVPVKNNIKAVMGGSLGGNMSFRLGRRPNVPWLPKFIVWSPASIWTSMGEGADIFKHFGPRSAWESANGAKTSPSENHRAAFFGGWDKDIIPLIIPMAQSDTWTSNHYLCKKSSIAAARLDRHETYDPRFLAWRWRLGAEQLLYSHQTIDPTTNRPRYMSNQKPMLLSCGTEDNVKFNDICSATQRTAPLMTMTPGKALFLEKTGHSLDNERRIYFAKEIVKFLGL